MAKQDNPLVTILFNIALPAIILLRLSKPEMLGPMYGLLLAICFPLGYGIFDFIKNKKPNFISILGFVSILLTGSFGLMHLDGGWFAIKEATIPMLMGVAVVGSLWTKTPLVRTILYNDKVIDVVKVDQELSSRGNSEAFLKLLTTTTWLLACSFLLSAVLNFGLAKYLLVDPPNTPEFNAALAKMTAMSYPVIVVPCMAVTMLALWYLLHGIKKLTGMDLESIFKAQPEKAKAPQKET